MTTTQHDKRPALNIRRRSCQLAGRSRGKKRPCKQWCPWRATRSHIPMDHHRTDVKGFCANNVLNRKCSMSQRQATHNPNKGNPKTMRNAVCDGHGRPAHTPTRPTLYRGSLADGFRIGAPCRPPIRHSTKRPSNAEGRMQQLPPEESR